MTNTRAVGNGARARWAIFVSGRGSNFLAALNLGAQFDARLLFSSRPDALSVQRARRRGRHVITLASPINWKEVHRQLKAARINRIVLLGFMKLIPESFLSEWPYPIFNLHPSLLPAFPGLHALETSFAERGPMGVTVHEVTPEMDAGPIRFQQNSVANSADFNLETATLLIAKDEQRLVRRLLCSPALPLYLRAGAIR